MTLNYEVVLSNPEARRRIAAAGARNTQGLTAEDLLKIFDAVSPLGVSLEKLSGVLLPICDKIGIKMQRVIEGSVMVQLEARISGQYYDWGKSKRMIAHLLQAIRNDLYAQATALQSRVA